MWLLNLFTFSSSDNIGLGSRIYPLSEFTPKPMIEMNGYPFIYYLIERLEKYKFSEVLILVGYKKEKFENPYFNFP